MPQEILWHETRGKNAAWLYASLVLCPVCRQAHKDVWLPRKVVSQPAEELAATEQPELQPHALHLVERHLSADDLEDLAVVRAWLPRIVEAG